MRFPAVAALVSIVAALFAARPARAGAFDDPYDLPDAPRPPTLPELTHPDFEATLESTVGLLTPSVPILDTKYTHVQRIGLEAPLGPRRWFVGATYEFAQGSVPGVEAGKLVGGNTEIYGRTVWATRTGLAFGGGLALMLPTAAFDQGSPAASVAAEAASLRPWDIGFFTGGIFGVRPYVDVRAVDNGFVVQFRQGLDVSFHTRDASDRLTSAIASAYVGYTIAGIVSPGLEAFELYQIDAQIPDKQRSSLIVSPSVRVQTPYVQPALSAFTNIGPAVASDSDRIWGLRLAITVVYDPTTATIERGTRGHGREQ